MLAAQYDLQPFHPLELAGLSDRIFSALAAKGGKSDQLMINATT